jgi:hypothetical protein
MGESLEEGIVGELEAAASILRVLHEPRSLAALLAAVKALDRVHSPQDLHCVDVVNGNFGE